MARIKEILVVPQPGSLFDRLLDASDRRVAKRRGPLADWLNEARNTWFKTSSLYSEEEKKKRHRRYLMAWFFCKPFSDTWYLIEACFDKNER